MLGSMLDSTKSGILKYIILFFIVFAAGGLVLTDVGGFFTGGNIGTNVVAKVAGKDITAQQFDRGFRQKIYQDGMTPQEGVANGEAQKYLDSLILKNLLYQLGVDNGLEVSRDLLLNDVKQLISAYNVEDMSNAEAFQLFLRNNGLSEEQFLNDLRQQKIVQMMGTILTGITVVPEGLGRDYAQAVNQSRRVSALVFDPDDIDFSQDITEEELRAYYQTTQYLYNTPERRSFDVLRIDTDIAQQNTVISDEDLRDYYELNIDMYTTPETRVLEQILINDEAKANEAYRLISEEGYSIKEAADEIEASSAYRPTNDFTRNGLADELRGPVFDAEKNTVLAPVETALGWHVVKVTDIKGETVTPFEEAKESVRDVVSEEYTTDALYELSLDIEEAADSGIGAAEIADEFELPLTQYSEVKSNGVTTNGDNLFEDNENKNLLLSTAFNLGDYETSQLLSGDDGSYMIVTVTNITESAPRPFEEVRSDVRADYLSSQRRQKALTMAENTLIKLRSGEESFENAGKVDGVRYDVIKGFSQYQKPALYLSEANIVDLFNAEYRDILMFDDQERIVIARVDTLQLLDQFDLTDDISNAQGPMLNQLISDSSFQILLDALYDRYEVMVNQQAIRDLYFFDE